MTSNLKRELALIYNKLINHAEYSKEKREYILAKELKSRLNSYSELKNTFKKETIGGYLIRFSMPFVAINDNEILCTIKSLSFGQKESGNMMEHCDSWVARVIRVANENLINFVNVLFTIDRYKKSLAAGAKAMDEI